MFTTDSIKSEVITVTPAIAEQLLAKNTNNRKVSAIGVAKIKRSLARGEWKLNGEAVKVSQDGRVLDGQHRLIACVESGIPFQTLIITGLPDDVQSTLDTGKSRSIADVLALRGVSNANHVAATVAAVIRIEQYGLRSAFATSSRTPVSAAEAVARLESEPTLEDLSKDTVKLGRVGLPARIASALYYVFSGISVEDTDYFFRKLYEGDDLVYSDPILTLRNTLLSTKDTARGDRNPVWIAAVTIKAWNKYRSGEPLSLIKWNPGGANPEKFPEPK